MSSSQRSTVTTLCLNTDTPLACYNFDLHQPILITFGGNVA